MFCQLRCSLNDLIKIVRLVVAAVSINELKITDMELERVFYSALQGFMHLKP